MDNKPQRPPRPKMDFKMLGRVMGYIFKYYKIQIAIVFICIILNTLASVGGNLYLQVLIDDHIVPLVGAENPVLTGLIKKINSDIVDWQKNFVKSRKNDVFTRFFIYLEEFSWSDLLYARL